MAAATFAFRGGKKNVGGIVNDVEKAYAHIRAATGQDFDPHEAAKAEVAWWVARRTPGHNSVEEVGSIIAELYAILYGQSNPDIEYAGYLRAKAARVRDKSADWVEVEKLLQQSYTHLLAGIGQQA